MSKRLIIMRHAQSLPTSMTADHERPLDEVGIKQAPKTAHQLVQAHWIPDLVLRSDAKRTKETWKLSAPILGQVPIIFTHELYHATVAQILTLIKTKASDSQTLMLLGHNPTAEALATWLSTKALELGTASAALLEADLDWSDILNKKGQWNFKKIITP